MGEGITGLIERLLHRVEDRVEQWRQQDIARKAAAAAHREALWAEAREREKLLAAAISQEEAARTLETCVERRNRLAGMVPGKDAYGHGAGLKGSWLVFEPPE